MSLDKKKLFKDLWMILSITIISILAPYFEINAMAKFQWQVGTPATAVQAPNEDLSVF